MSKNLNSRLRAAKKQKNQVGLPEPAPIVQPIEIKESARNEATLEVLAHLLSQPLKIDSEAIGSAVKEAVAAIPAPIVNIPPRVPLSYDIQFHRSSRDGGLVGARIDPILGEEA